MDALLLVHLFIGLILSAIAWGRLGGIERCLAVIALSGDPSFRVKQDTLNWLESKANDEELKKETKKD